MKILATAGLDDADRALVEKHFAAAQRLTESRWALQGVEAGMDLLVVDLAHFAGRVARVRALEDGIHFAVLADADADSLGAAFVLQRPVTAATFAGLLDVVALQPRPSRRDNDDFAMLTGSISLAGMSSAAQTAPNASEEGGNPNRASFREPRSARVCSNFTALVLRGPIVVERPGLPALSIDPAEGMYYCDAKLAALEPYILDVIKGKEYRRLSSASLALLKESGAAQPLVRLHWLEALLRSNGLLASHLDPGGSYRVRSWLQVDGEYRKQFRIATMMLRPATLDKIARASNATMDEVFDVVNAYDALGLLEWTPRRSRYAAETPQKKPEGKRGLGARIPGRRRRLMAAAALIQQ